MFYGFCKRVESSYKGLAPLHSNIRNEAVYIIYIYNEFVSWCFDPCSFLRNLGVSHPLQKEETRILKTYVCIMFLLIISNEISLRLHSRQLHVES